MRQWEALEMWARSEMRQARMIRWPSSHYEGKPVEFAREVLGVEPTPKQAEIMRAIVKPGARVAVRSGNRVGKTFLSGIIALYWFATYAKGRVILSAPVLRQVEDLVWRSVRELHAQSGVCFDCRRDGYTGKQCEHSTRLDGKPERKPESGLSVNLRQVKGFTVVSAENSVGYAGLDQLWIGDEAAGLRNDWLEVALANCSGGGSILAIGNPTRNTGFHADAFRRKWKDGECFWTDRFTISCFDTPNLEEGRDDAVPGLVNARFPRDAAILWGVDSFLYRTRVLGEHAENPKGQLISLEEWTRATTLWRPPDGTEEGELRIGIDCAGLGGVAGDKWVFTVTRGHTMLDMRVCDTMTPEALSDPLCSLIVRWRHYEREPCRVRYDAEGTTGIDAAAWLEAIRNQSPHVSFDLEPVKASARLPAESPYGTKRDAMYANFAQWLRDGGTVMPDMRLEEEALVMRWIEDPKWGKEKILDKLDVKRDLNDHRSPDRLESLVIGLWDGLMLSSLDRRTQAAPGYVDPIVRGCARPSLNPMRDLIRAARRGKYS